MDATSTLLNRYLTHSFNEQPLQIVTIVALVYVVHGLDAKARWLRVLYQARGAVAAPLLLLTTPRPTILPGRSGLDREGGPERVMYTAATWVESSA